MDVTVISSSDEDDNYGGLLECARQLGGKISEKSKMSTNSMEGGIKSDVEPSVEPFVSKMPISKSVDNAPISSILMASSLSHLEEAIHVSLIHFNHF